MLHACSTSLPHQTYTHRLTDTHTRGHARRKKLLQRGGEREMWWVNKLFLDAWKALVSVVMYKSLHCTQPMMNKAVFFSQIYLSFLLHLFSLTSFPNRSSHHRQNGALTVYSSTGKNKPASVHSKRLKNVHSSFRSLSMWSNWQLKFVTWSHTCMKFWKSNSECSLTTGSEDVAAGDVLYRSEKRMKQMQGSTLESQDVILVLLY